MKRCAILFLEMQADPYEKAYAEILSLPHPYYAEGRRLCQRSLFGMRALNGFMGDPCGKLRIIHVAGTNGKGSCVNMIASVLMAAGKKVGVYQSPHIRDCRERISIDGRMISRRDFCRIWNRQRDYALRHRNPYSEVLVSLALVYFKEQNVDFAVIEVGIGGRNDPTNICKRPELCLITSLGLDHTRLLGRSLAAIAFQKAGIIKPRTPVVFGNVSRVGARVIRAVAQAKRARCYDASEYWNALSPSARIEHSPDFDLQGGGQEQNVKTVVTAIEVLIGRGGVDREDLPLATERQALSHAARTMSFCGRWQVLRQRPLVVCDNCSNFMAWRENIKKVAGLMRSGAVDRLFVILGFCAFDDVEQTSIRRLTWPRAEYVIADSSSTMDAGRLRAALGTKWRCEKSVASALERCLRKATRQDMIFIAGSIYMLKDVFSYFRTQVLS